MSKQKLKISSDIKDQIKEFRAGSVAANSWIVFGYEGKKKLTVVASGEGYVNEIKEHLIPGECRYILIRKEWKVELANTTKFAFISWTPSVGIKPMRRAMLSIHRGQAKDILSPTHVTLEAEELSEVTEEEINGKFGFSSGTKVHVTQTTPKKRGSVTRGDKKFVGSSPGAAKRNVNIKPKYTKSGAAASPKKSKNRAIKFIDGAAITDAIVAVKADSNETDWMLAVYAEGGVKKMQLLETGSGGLEEMLSKLDSEHIFYGYFRVTEINHDNITTVKFGYLKLMSPKVSPVKRARVATHRGFILEIFTPSHVEFDIGDPSEISAKLIMEGFAKASGTHSHITEKKESLMANKMRVNKEVTHHVNVDTERSMKFVDEGAFKDALKNVRDDSHDADWMLASYIKKNQIGLIGSGEGGLSQLVDALEDTKVNFGFLRVVEMVDRSTTVKFIFVKWMPRNISTMLKAEVATKKGVIDALFTPWHVDFFIETKDEISDELVKDKVAAAAGTRDNVTSGKEVLGIGQMR